MSTWSSIIGNCENLQGNTVRNELGKFLYINILQNIEDIFQNSGSDENYFEHYETLSMALNPPGKEEPKNTYYGEKTTKEKNGKIKTVIGNHPVKKLVNVMLDTKLILVYLLNVYFNECRICYEKLGSFPPTDKILVQFNDHIYNTVDSSITPFIFKVVNMMNIEKKHPGNLGNVFSKIVEKAAPYFKSENYTPTEHVAILLGQFFKFVKILAVLIAPAIWERKQAINPIMIIILLRQLDVLTGAGLLTEETMYNIKQFVDTNKEKIPSGKGKTSKTKPTISTAPCTSEDIQVTNTDYLNSVEDEVNETGEIAADEAAAADINEDEKEQWEGTEYDEP